jgi:hypothetical protein
LRGELEIAAAHNRLVAGSSPAGPTTQYQGVTGNLSVKISIGDLRQTLCRTLSERPRRLGEGRWRSFSGVLAAGPGSSATGANMRCNEFRK